MFKVVILDMENETPIFSGVASCVVLPGEEGEFSVLDFHQPIVSCLKEGMIRVDQRKPLAIKEGIARIRGNELCILVEQ